MTARFADYQGLSQVVYQENLPGVVTINGQHWENIQVKNDPVTGYTGAVFINQETKEMILVNRGTETSDVRDIVNDIQMVANKIPVQYLSSQSLLQYAQNYAQEHGYNLSLTGHSLGGSDVELQGLQTGLPTITFNAELLSLYRNNFVAMLLVYFHVHVVALRLVLASYSGSFLV